MVERDFVKSDNEWYEWRGMRGMMALKNRVEEPRDKRKQWQ